MEIKNLVRENIRQLVPYSSARSLFSGENAILLDANENGRDIFGSNLNRYPDPLQKKLKEKIAELKAVAPGNVFLGNGSDEAIDLLLRVFCQPEKDEVIICPPTYGMYSVQAHIQGVGIREVLLDKDFGVRPDAILAAVTPATKMLFICSPNNPTGNLMDDLKVTALLAHFPGIVVVDEAYIDYAEAMSWIARLKDFPNLVVLQTFSKAWALAGMRIGMAFASAEIIHYLNSVKFPYNINQLTQQTLLGILENENNASYELFKNREERKRLRQALAQFPFVNNIYPSEANFLLVKMENSNRVFNWLKSNGIIVRNRSKEPLCDNCLRITVGTPEENDQLINALKNYEKSTVS